MMGNLIAWSFNMIERIEVKVPKNIFNDMTILGVANIFLTNSFYKNLWI